MAKATTKKEQNFVRRIKKPGFYTAVFGGKTIKIVDREIFATDNKDLIKFLKNDPELEVYKTKDPVMDAKVEDFEKNSPDNAPRVKHAKRPDEADFEDTSDVKQNNASLEDIDADFDKIKAEADAKKTASKK